MAGECWNVNGVVANADTGDDLQFCGLFDNAAGEGSYSEDCCIVFANMLQDIFLCVVSEMLVVDVVLAFQNRFDAIGDWGLDHDFVGHL